MKKDYWNILRRDFRILGVLSFFSSSIVIFALINTNILTDQKSSIFTTSILYIISTIIYFVLASLFEKRSPFAITFGYTFIFGTLGYSLFNNFINDSFANFPNGIMVNLLRYLIFIYLLINVYKASKQNTVSNS